MNGDTDNEKGKYPPGDEPKSEYEEYGEVNGLLLDEEEEEAAGNGKTAPALVFQDISSHSKPEATTKEKTFFNDRFKPFWFDKNKRNLKIAVTALCVVIAIAAAVSGAKIYQWLNAIDIDPGEDYSNADATFEDETDFSAMHDISDANSLNDLLYKWANKSGKMSSKNVVNVLLIGVDSEDGSMSNARSDAMILVSLNKVTEKITLVSFMRDSYTYMNINGQDRYSKINHSYVWGGPATLIETIENNYKIEIDHYVSVDFKTFPDIINSLGGVTVEVKAYEARYINDSPKYSVEVGKEVTLNGIEALIFSRIRYSDTDGDVSRTRRQRAIIMAMIESTRTAKIDEIKDALNTVFPNIKTNFKKTEILSLSTQALSKKWMDFEIQQIISPGENTRKSASIDGSVWVVDYPAEAAVIQTAIYGKTNIVLDSDRDSALNMLRPKTTTPRKSTTVPRTETTVVTEPAVTDTTATSIEETSQSTQPDITEESGTLPGTTEPATAEPGETTTG